MLRSRSSPRTRRSGTRKLWARMWHRHDLDTGCPPVVHSVMATHLMDTLWPACVLFVVHVPNITIIRECNNHLRSQEGVHLVPNCAARYYNRVLGAHLGAHHRG